jgi:hypothetical protein
MTRGNKRLSHFHRNLTLCILLSGVTAIAPAFAESPAVARQPSSSSFFWIDEDTPNAPVDYGYGPGAGQSKPKASSLSRFAIQSLAVSAAIPNGGTDAATKGYWAAPVSWPLIPIHMVLLPDGRVLNYGTNDKGAQGAQFIYDVWDPTLGTGTDSHLTLPNTTQTDIFCGAQSVIGPNFDTFGSSRNDGDVVLSGGDLTVDGVRNYSNNKTSLFYPASNELTSAGQMKYPRWYGSFVPLRNGDKLIMGGTLQPKLTAMIAEVYRPGIGWRTVSNINLGDAREYFYPRSFLGTEAAVYYLNSYTGQMFRLTTDGDGTMESMGYLATPGAPWYPTVMFEPGKILTVRNNNKVQVIDFGSPNPAANTKPTPVVTQIASLSQDRIWSNGTVLPDGKVLVTGGSGVANELTNIAYHAEIWDPSTGKWSIGASAAKARLYHSTALLLPDATVVTGGGGAPGPIAQLNAEIYYPPYLYKKDGSGQPAPRPMIASAPSAVKLGQYISVKVGSGDQIGGVSLMHTGSVTHSIDMEQRLLKLPFTQTGDTLSARIPNNPNNVPPGYYMLFVLDKAGVPSVAKIVSVPRSVL